MVIEMAHYGIKHFGLQVSSRISSQPAPHSLLSLCTSSHILTPSRILNYPPNQSNNWRGTTPVVPDTGAVLEISAAHVLAEYGDDDASPELACQCSQYWAYTGIPLLANQYLNRTGTPVLA